MVRISYPPMIIPKYIRQFPNSLSLLKGSLSSKSYTCRYATSGSDNLSSYLIILNVIEMHTSIF